MAPSVAGQEAATSMKFHKPVHSWGQAHSLLPGQIDILHFNMRLLMPCNRKTTTPDAEQLQAWHQQILWQSMHDADDALRGVSNACSGPRLQGMGLLAAGPAGGRRKGMAALQAAGLCSAAAAYAWQSSRVCSRQAYRCRFLERSEKKIFSSAPFLAAVK